MSAKRGKDYEEESQNESQSGEGEEYEVEAIRDKRKFGKEWKYQIKWIGYPEEQNTWEPIENLENVWDQVMAFEAEWKEKQEKKNNNMIKKSIQQPNATRNIQSIFPPKRNDFSGAPSQFKNHSQKRVDDEDDYSDFTGKKTFRSEEEEKMNIMSSSSNHLNFTHSRSLDLMPNSRSTLLEMRENETNEKMGGDIEQDHPKRITAAKLDYNNDVLCLIEWEPRHNGFKPNQTYVSNKQLRYTFPQLLIDFYESRLRFPSASK